MRDYDHLIITRTDLVDGIGPWYWLKSDTGAWDGPKKDWEEHHSHKWFTHVKNWDVCFQAGSCLGMYPRLLNQRFARVYTCEPDPLNFFVAGLNCQRDGIHRFNAVVGERSGEFTGVVRSGMDNVGMHTTSGIGTTPILAIDTLNLPVCGLIALDIEGYEIHALRGAVETIKRCSPVVTCERPSGDVTELMRTLGYVADCESVSDTVFVQA